MSPYIFIRVSVRASSTRMTVIHNDSHGATSGCPESEPGAALRDVVLEWVDDAVWFRLVQHGLWPSLHMCAPRGLILCLWWYWSHWGVLLSMVVPEVATCWDLDSSRCEGVKWMFVKLKTTFFSSFLIWPSIERWDYICILPCFVPSQAYQMCVLHLHDAVQSELWSQYMDRCICLHKLVQK